MEQQRITTSTIKQKKDKQMPITMLTAYDYTMAKIIDGAGIDMLLVGDSLGNVVLGYESTLPVTMDEMIHHVKAVSRGAKRAMIVADMPFMSYQVSAAEALRNAGRFLKETAAQAVKIEGGQEMVAAIKSLVQAGIPVMGHLGLTPQSVHQLGGYKVQGKSEQAAKKLLEDAKALETGGVFALVLECVPSPLARIITESAGIPTIGIGAGPYCDGQVLVINDLLGINPGNTPKFVKQYANLHEHIAAAVTAYKKDVNERVFPGPEHSFTLDDIVLRKL
ncbi:MAG TPA: 3-methyl-2-oxobutanoate hydroxymethyltransferase [Methylomusa anaerophila]|uniref:3-methyl-2-oxobutanoate hydroxymethyltransferase n=2 Tax=Methylomusa anaerophila TaxID=1930071 RepID=A0A348ALK7_9FIRM|nr:3-methyl-2-oxobutanoate hydroxymethyltransferase [Methylomusa anaerophila]BBB91955.1 3-methyl-2-oxobutanoate hydroxymethyltransferase [Methylomusa anaerophila]HML88033.1 3-methyl-2-oxobutanoate hydroxymethyltransferase [Methylomusa anaerophila]